MTTTEDATMTDAELRTQREYLGLSTRQLAEALGVAERSVNRWEYGHWPVPDGVRDEVAGWMDEAADGVAAMVEAGAPIVTYRNDEQYREAVPGSKWPASWHRMIAARAADEAGVGVVYADGAE